MQTSALRTVSLNTWADNTGEILRDIKRHQQNAHVLCFQEVHDAAGAVPDKLRPRDPGKRTGPVNTRLFEQIANLLLPNFVGYYAPQMQGHLHDTEATEYEALQYGNALFVRRELEHTYRDAFIYGHPGKAFDDPPGTPVGKTGQAIDIITETGIITIAHGHGAWYRSDKTSDFAWRNEQVEGIRRLIAPPAANQNDAAVQPRVIFVGDLNVVSATQTVCRLAKAREFGTTGAWHLNGQYRIFNTRTRLYTGDIKEADHAFATPSLQAKLWIDDTVQSDHAALIVETSAVRL